jgi:outer membrane beta-barrel protein
MNSKFLSLVLFMSFLFSSKILANEKDVYEFSWLDPDKEVYVLQNRKFRKAGHLYVNAGAGVTTSGAFVDSTSLQGRVGFFVSEDYGAEVLYAKNSGKENSTAEGVRGSSGTSGSGSTPFRRIVQNYTGFMAVWSPFYSKINTFNKIIYMDWIFGVGYAQLQEQNNKLVFVNNTATDDKDVTSETHSGVIWEAGMKFYLNESFSVRTDLTGVHFSTQNVATAGTSYFSNFDATLSLGYTF